MDEIRPFTFDAFCELVRILDSTLVIQIHAVHIRHTKHGIKAFVAHPSLFQKFPVCLFLGGAGLLLGLFTLVALKFLFDGLVFNLPTVLLSSLKVILRFFELPLYLGQCFRIGLILCHIGFQTVHGFSMHGDNLVDLLVLNTHSLEGASGECHNQSPFLRPQCFGATVI